MKTNATGLAVLLLLAVAWTSASAQRRGIITCSCPIGNGISQQGKLVGNLCYIVGVGSCRSFNYEGSSQSQQQQQQYQPQQYQQAQQQEPTDQYTQQQEYQNQYKNLYQQQYQQRQQQQQPQQDQYQPQYTQQDQYSSQSQANQRSYPYQSQSRFQNRYDSGRPSHSRFSSPSSHQPQQQHRNFNSRHFNSAPAPTDTAITPSRRFEASRPGRFDLAAAAATASPEQARAAAEDARRQLDSRRSFESHLAESGVTVRPGSAEAAQAAERRPDEKSAELGNKALAQILFLQSLLGRNGRR